MPTSENSIEMIIEPKVSDLGDGFQVRRLLPSMKRRNVGPFVFWDHMGPVEIEGDKELKVRAHPHIGLSTLTYLFQGQIFHRDSLGNEQAIRPGEINWMTAGKWVAHSERSDASMCSCLEGIQVWVALPKESEDVAPSFDQDALDLLHNKKNLRLLRLNKENLLLSKPSGLFEKEATLISSPVSTEYAH